MFWFTFVLSWVLKLDILTWIYQERNCSTMEVVQMVRRLLGVSVFILLFVIACGKSPVEDGKSYMILAKDGNSCLDVPGGNAGPVQIILWSPSQVSNAAPNQVWLVRRVGEGYKIFSSHSGLCLDVAGGSDANEAAVVQYGDSGDTALHQLWKITQEGDFVRFVSLKTGKFLDGKQGAPGTALVQHEFTDERANGQLWQLRLVQ
jgi:hypothetical protein